MVRLWPDDNYVTRRKTGISEPFSHCFGSFSAALIHCSINLYQFRKNVTGKLLM
jgi:hypothetical protein